MYPNNMNMNMNMPNSTTPVAPYYWGQQNYNAPHYDIIKVNGENGANAFNLGPNSKVLLLDETAPIVWFVQTDGAGYKTVTPYSITPYQPIPPVDVNDLAARLQALEEKVNAKSNSGTSNKNAKRQSNTNVAAGTTVAEQP